MFLGMNKYKISFEIEHIGPVEFDVTEKTYHEISKFCQEKFPEVEWNTSYH